MGVDTVAPRFFGLKTVAARFLCRVWAVPLDGSFREPRSFDHGLPFPHVPLVPTPPLPNEVPRTGQPTSCPRILRFREEGEAGQRRHAIL